MSLPRALVMLASLTVGAGCGGEGGAATAAAGGTGGAPPECGDTEVLVLGSCQPVGVGADGCAVGFEYDGRGGCNPLVPLMPCPPGLIALPGETQCHEIVDCGSSRWGAAPIESDTQFVDASFVGASDGSESAPWQTIAPAIFAATPGAVIAVAAGTYPESNWVDKPIRFWGRCPAMVTLQGQPGTIPGALILESAAVASEVHHLAIVGAREGLAVVAPDVLIEGVWIHDTKGFYGFFVGDANGPADMTVRESLLESNQSSGLFMGGGVADVERVVVRDTLADPQGLVGTGVALTVSPVSAEPSSLSMRSSIIERTLGAGVSADGSDVTLEAVWIHDVAPQTFDGTDGMGLVVVYNLAIGRAPTADVTGVVLEDTFSAGIALLGADGNVVGSTIRRVSREGSTTQGNGVIAQIRGARPAMLTLGSTLVEGGTTSGTLVWDSSATFQSAIVRGSTGADGLFGDGIIVVRAMAPETTTQVRSCRVEGNSRAGIAVFGGEATLADTTLECNPLSIAAEPYLGRPGVVVDSGGNRCRCGVTEAYSICRPASAGLAPPSPP